MAVEFGVARQTISKQLKEFGIETRVPGKVQNRKRGLAYGKKVKDRKIVDHKKEYEVILKIKELRDQGFSYHKIADVLNVMKVPTKIRKGSGVQNLCGKLLIIFRIPKKLKLSTLF